jgi:hypothetical protein
MFEATQPDFFSAQGQSAYSQAAVQDYGNVGDQRPYQIVYPAYHAPEFLKSFRYLQEALRECDTLCKLTGQPFRLMKWGTRIPCRPCPNRKIRDNMLPSFRFKTGYIESRGALEGYPEAFPVAEMLPNGQRTIFGPMGQEQSIGVPDFRIYVADIPPGDYNAPQPLPTNYIDSIRAGEYLSSQTGRRMYICSSFGADCAGRNPEKWLPVVYVQPGGLSPRYPQDFNPNSFGSQSAYGSQTIVSPVTPEMFQELLELSQGGTNLPWNAT